MKRTLLTAGALALALGAASAQTNTTSPLPAPRAPVDTTAPLPGANSFTEAQVRERLVSNGFADIGALAKDNQGIWRGRATRNGVQTPVAVDYRGNVFQQ
jgi:putative membrane protein